MLGLQERGITLVGEEFKQHYELVSVNYHIPSEHVIDGVRYAVERQMHFAPTDHAAGSASSDTDVVAATSQRNIYSELYDVDTSEGATGDFLIQQLIDAGNLGSGLGDSMARQVNNIRTEFDFLNYPHFYYPGSQTSPPCHEKVNWRISSGIKMVTPQQLQVLADIVHDMYASRSQGSPLPYPTSAYPGTKTTGWDTHQGTARPIMQNNNRSMIMRPFYQHQCVWGNDLQC